MDKFEKWTPAGSYDRGGIEYLLTADKNLQHQQNLDMYPVKLVVVRTYDNRYKHLKTLVPRIEEELKKIPDEVKVWEIDLRK